MRKLASIQKILALDPIEGADAILKATVLGWQLVVKKDEFKVGDLVIYCEIDSLLPERPEFAFMEHRKMRVRTIRLRGQISQGICFPLSLLPTEFAIEEDADCTEILKITKFAPPIPACLEGITKGKFPSFIPKTDETRVQVLQDVLDTFRGTKCYVAEKLDGSSTTYYFKEGEFSVCSRNLELLESEGNSLWKVARELDIENKLRTLNRNIAIQGELIGEGIQSNRMRLRGQSIRFFDAFDIDKHSYLNFEEFNDLFQKLDLPTVPILSTEYILQNNIDDLVKMATIKTSFTNEVWAEGIVIRPIDSTIAGKNKIENLSNGRISFKAINPEFLLKFGE